MEDNKLVDAIKSSLNQTSTPPKRIPPDNDNDAPSNEKTPKTSNVDQNPSPNEKITQDKPVGQKIKNEVKNDSDLNEVEKKTHQKSSAS